MARSAVSDRSGKPTVRELLSSLVFNPVDGTIRLNGERVVMQRGAVGVELRRELINLLGEQETRVFLMRLGFLSGRADARFVRTSWPDLELFDAFTAGTRLHTFSGVVRVETVFNDFDFRKRRFSAEFLWHDSVEAEEFRRDHRHATEPTCWTQVGYASGYASEFFDTLVVYKEVQCRAEGHDHCRVIGKPADMWSTGDPDVILFRERIAMALDHRQPVARRTSTSRAANAFLSELDRIMVAPVAEVLDRFAPMAMPVLFEGATGTGRSRAAHYLHHLSSSSDSNLRQVAGSQVDTELCLQIAQPARGGKRNLTGAILIDDLRQVPPDVQPRLARSIEDGLLTGGPRVFAMVEAEPNGSPSPPLNPGLWYAVSALTVRMPCLRDRPADLVAMASALLPTLAARMGKPAPSLDASATRAIAQAGWPGNLRQMRSVLGAVLGSRKHDGPIAGCEIETQLGYSAPPSIGPAPADGLRSWIEHSVTEGTLSLREIESEIYRTAVSQSGGNLSAAARLVGITRAQLAYRLKMLAANPEPAATSKPI
jgi:DNA-binding NtrC family response regulator